MFLFGVAVVAPTVTADFAYAAANDCEEDGQGGYDCDQDTGDPDDPKPPNDNGDGGNIGPASFTAPPKVCTYRPFIGEAQPVDCYSKYGWWSNSDQCYWWLSNPQNPVPAGQNDNVGAWYTCYPIVDDQCTINVDCAPRDSWLLRPPPGVDEYTPAQAAGKMATTFTLKPITIGMAPVAKVHSDDPPGTAPYRRTWVGVPVWLWVDNPTASTWGPISKTATYGKVSVTAKAEVTSLNYDTGDGRTIACSNGGTPFDAAAWANRAAEDSPTCGFRYQNTSKGGAFTVSATSTWAVKWTGGGQSGQILMPSTTTTTTVRVGELQSVNVSSDGDSLGG